MIEVGDVGDERVRLCEPQENTAGQYAALNYCWGTGQPLTTTSANIKDRISGLWLSELPQTLADAIHVTRALHIQYLWVDALCIIQESVEDWEKQSEKMSIIYEKAYLVIAASSSISATQGFLNHKRQRRTYHLPLPDIYGTQATIAARENLQSGFHSRNIPLARRDKMDPLAERAWAFQEQHMSTRCLSFSVDELQWVCKTEVACECGRPAEEGLYHPLLRTCCDDSHEDDVPSAELTSQARSVWRAVVQDYSSRRITRADDILPAISGIASRFGARMGLRYVAGVWKENIIEELAWSSLYSHSSISTSYDAPSFSWASIHGDVRYGSRRSWADWVSCSSVSETGSVVPGRNPFGKVSDAWITLKALVLPGLLDHNHVERVTFRSNDRSIEVLMNLDSAVCEFNYIAEDNKTGRSMRRCNFLLPHTTGLESEKSGKVDKHSHAEEPASANDTMHPDPVEADGWLLHLGRWSHDQEGGRTPSLGGDFYLLLGRSPRNPQKYERIGSLRDYDGHLIFKYHGRFTSQTITIL